MNFSRISHMVQQGDMSLNALKYLIGCRAECEMLDYKIMLSLDNNYSICSFAKDVLAIKNIGGGYLIIGVEDKTWKPVGIPNELPYDSKMLKDKVRKATGLELDIIIVHHTLVLENIEKLFAIVFIRSTRKRSKLRVPAIVKNDYYPTEKYGLHSGDIYVRINDETKKIKTGEELESCLDDIAEKDLAIDESGNSLTDYAVCEGLYRLLDKGFDRFIGRQSYKEDLLKRILSDDRIWIINVHGPGGVGKSSLVNWAIYELYDRKSFDSILHFSAKDTKLTASGIRSCSRNLYSLEDLIDNILLTFEEILVYKEKNTESLQQKIAVTYEIFQTFSVLLILDNMETVNDARIYDFIQNIPPSSTKVIITSRVRSEGWELPFPLKELSDEETKEFIAVKSSERDIKFPADEKTIKKVQDYSGGLPLAIQWIIGQYALTRNFENFLNSSFDSSSPILEFSFRNTWNLLSIDSKKILAIFPIFEQSPSLKDLSIATNMSVEMIEKSIRELTDCTLITQQTTVEGRIIFSALPITINFAKYELSKMTKFEINCRERLNKYNSVLFLQESEIGSYKAFFDKYSIENDNEKKAIIHVKRAISETSLTASKVTDQYIKEAIDISPESTIVKILIAEYYMGHQKLTLALDSINQAEKNVNKRYGKLLYITKAKIYESIRNWQDRIEALKLALKYDSDDNYVKHQYGVALSKSGRTSEAIEIFTQIIDSEKNHEHPTDTYVLALKTRIINASRMGKTTLLNSDRKLMKDIIQKYPYFESLVENIEL